MPNWTELLSERLTCGKLYHARVELSPKDLSKRIRAYLRNHVSDQPYDFLLSDWWTWDESVEVSDPFDSEWTTFGERRVVYNGRATKRLSKALKVKYGIALPEKMNSAIGQFIQSWNSGNGNYQFDFTRQIDWDAGDFGENGACFWSTNAAAKDMLMDDPHFYAMRFYDPDAESDRAYGTNRGIGRAWIIQRPMPHRDAPADVLYPYIFNGYWYAAGSSDANHDRGKDHDCTRLAAKVLAAHLDAEAHLVTAANYGDTSSTLYINAGRAYVIAPADTPLATSIDFQVRKQFRNCSYCSRRIRLTTDKFEYDPRYGEGANSPIYCPDCFALVFRNCVDCDQLCAVCDMSLINDVDATGTQYVCTACWRDHYYNCGRCGITYRRETSSPTRLAGLRHVYCEQCVAHLRGHCELCGGITQETDNRLLTAYTYSQITNSTQLAEDDVFWQRICNNCLVAYAHLKRCSRCNCVVQSSEYITHDLQTNGYLCEVCLRLDTATGRVRRPTERANCEHCGCRYYTNDMRNRAYGLPRGMYRLCGACYEERLAHLQPRLDEQQRLLDEYRQQPTTARDELGRFISPKMRFWRNTRSATEAVHYGDLVYVLVEDVANENGVRDEN